MWSSLDELQAEINRCEVCRGSGLEITKPAHMERGGIASIMVIGEQPGKTEVKKGVAFSGVGGRKLMEWLGYPDISEEKIRGAVYFTSLLKCAVPEDKFDVAWVKCRHFLMKQLGVIGPKVIVTLGIKPLQKLYREGVELDDLVGKILPRSPFPSLFGSALNEAVLIALPHPSGKSTWLNSLHNREKLNQVLPSLRAMINS